MPASICWVAANTGTKFSFFDSSASEKQLLIFIFSTYPDLKKHVIDKFEELKKEFPPAYELYLDGEDESTTDAQKPLTPGVIPAVIIILFIME